MLFKLSRFSISLKRRVSFNLDASEQDLAASKGKESNRRPTLPGSRSWLRSLSSSSSSSSRRSSWAGSCDRRSEKIRKTEPEAETKSQLSIRPEKNLKVWRQSELKTKKTIKAKINTGNFFTNILGFYLGILFLEIYLLY